MQTYIDTFLTYISSEKGLSKNTREAYERDLRGIFSFLKKEQIAREDLISYFSYLKNKGLASSSICRSFIAIKVFLRFLKKEGLLQKDPGSFLEIPKVWQLIPEVMSYSEVEALLDQPQGKDFMGSRDKAILELLYATGMRVSELCGLRVMDVDDQFVKVKGKGKKERLVPLGQKALQAIDDYLINFKKESDWLFTSKNGKQLDRITVWNRIKFYAKKAGIDKNKNISPHTLRHSFATHLLENGTDIKYIRDLLGHSNIRTTLIYTKVSNKNIRNIKSPLDD